MPYENNIVKQINDRGVMWIALYQVLPVRVFEAISDMVGMVEMDAVSSFSTDWHDRATARGQKLKMEQRAKRVFMDAGMNHGDFDEIYAKIVHFSPKS